MLFKKKNEGKNILRLGLTLNIPESIAWVRDKKTKISVVPYAKWGACEKFEYLIFILPGGAGIDWYFHKTAGEFSQSLSSCIELDQFLSRSDMRQISDNLSGDLELEIWNGMVSVRFCRRLILLAPLNEAASLISSGKTSCGYITGLHKQEINLPVSFNESGEAIDFISVHEALDGRGAGYSNSLAHFWMDVPAGPVVTRSR